MNIFFIVFVIFMGFLYVILPIDIIPDSYGLPGRIDDIGMMVLILIETFRHHAAVHMQKDLIKHIGEGTEWDPYRVLGLSQGANDKDIQTAFHHLSNQYQPEKMKKFNANLQKMAEQRLDEVKQAYEELSSE